MANVAIKNIENLSKQQLSDYIKQGGKFVTFQMTISIVVMTHRQSSAIYFIKPGEGTFKYSWPSTLVTAIMGWWGIPWGPIYTIGAFINNAGGKDLTNDVANQLGLNDHVGYNIPGANSTSNTNSNQAGSGYNIPGSNSNSHANANQSGSGYNIPGNNSSSNPNSNSNSGGYNIPR